MTAAQEYAVLGLLSRCEWLAEIDAEDTPTTL